MPTIIDNGNTHITIKTITARDYDLGTYSLILPAGSQPSEDDWDMISIEIKRPGEEERILVVSETSSFDEDCAVLNSNALSVLQGWTIYHIDVDNSTLLSTTELDTVCPNFSLYRIQDGYIVFGEIDVTMLDQKFDFVWSFSGHDVFCPMEEGLKPIELCDDRIKLFDFNGDYYELSYRGELITYCNRRWAAAADAVTNGRLAVCQRPA